MTHQIVYMVPREWLGCDNLEYTIWMEHYTYHSVFGQTKKFQMQLNGVKAHLTSYNKHFWLKRVKDSASGPHYKRYTAAYVPCIHCNRV